MRFDEGAPTDPIGQRAVSSGLGRPALRCGNRTNESGTT
jgi:hypothetical protein